MTNIHSSLNQTNTNRQASQQILKAEQKELSALSMIG